MCSWPFGSVGKSLIIHQEQEGWCRLQALRLLQMGVPVLPLSVISVLQADRWTVNPHFSGVALLSWCAPPVRDCTGRQRNLEYLHFVGETGLESLCVSPKVCIKGIALL